MNCALHRAWVSMRAELQPRLPMPLNPPPAPARVIRKYANRRLYDATASRHVTLEDLRRLIAGGERVQVIDDRTGEDLTRAVLLQIISEQEQFGSPVLTVQLLEGIIRFYGNPVQDMLSRYLEQGLGAVMQQQRAVQEQMAKAMEGPLAPLAELTRQNMEMWSRMQASMLSALNPQAGKAGGSEGPGAEEPGSGDDFRDAPPPPAADKSPKGRDGAVIGKMSLAQWQAVIDVNLTGVFLCGREAAERMVELGHGGVIINISSISRAGNIGQSNYTAAKAGVASLVVVWARELARYGIRVGGIAPGFTHTTILDSMKPELLQKIVAPVPVGRLGRPEEIAHAARFIFENDFFSGRIIELDGGLRI